ncbi:hypothetical protein [Archangium sp.]|uniref:hypothetical protein n=1 Tax=Archangium sp. TaxID=1872627 RepID=UPI00286C4F20|nr:hypothetical protein [Archangium sp.]
MLAAFAGLALGLALTGGVHPPARDEEVLRLLQAQARQLEALQGQLQAARSAHCAVSVAPGTVDVQALGAEVARLLKEELRARTAAAPTPVEPPAAPPQPSPLQLEARRQVDRLIDSARSSRQWGPSQAEEFRQSLPQLPGPQRQEVIHQLIVLLNSGQVDVQTGGAPF